MEKSETDEVSVTKVKREDISSEIKDFAETTMNELLGWYGYENSKEEPKTVRTCRSNSGSNDSEAESLKYTDGCGWCGKHVDENSSLTSSNAVYCSELCFSQSRRANFKRNKTCDWCRHVRHTVSYVDFQDGASQLQFCSDKCLNQYKMNIFCRETRAHLELHPHLLGNESTSGVLITPDLWLRNCKSPLNRPPTPSNKISESENEMSPLPLISVAHSSKLLANDVSKNRRSKLQKKTRKRCPSTVTSISPSNNNYSDDSPQDLRINKPVEETIVTKSSSDVECPRLQQSSENTNNTSEETNKVENSIKTILSGLLPPQTVFVPYPVILPLPIPIPIPIPIPNILKNNNNNKEIKNSSSQTEIQNEAIQNSTKRTLRKRKRFPEHKKKFYLKNKSGICRP